MGILKYSSAKEYPWKKTGTAALSTGEVRFCGDYDTICDGGCGLPQLIHEVHNGLRMVEYMVTIRAGYKPVVDQRRNLNHPAITVPDSDWEYLLTTWWL